ncbi:gapN [Symbiodinium sp. CCMP2456]|nr:gapN [Symbiodinium sp. CCMP2456]
MAAIGKPEVSEHGEVTSDSLPFSQHALVSLQWRVFKTRPYVDGAKTLIGGQVKPWPGIFSEIFSPVYCSETGERICIGRQATMSPKESVLAVQAAAKAWDLGRGEWPRKTLEQRVAAVEKLMGRLKEIREKIVTVLQWEICKNDADAAKEFDRTIDFIQALIATARRMDSTGPVCQEGVHALLKRSPVGVMMNMGPSNYPFNETYATLIPALLIGDSVVMKVPNTGGLAHFLTMEAYAECFPAGVVNFVSGRGRDTMPPCMESGLVDIFAFIGSSKAADALVKAHPQPHRLKNLLSLDAKNLAIVMPDADLDLAVKECLAGSTSFNGQRCTAIKLIMAHRSIAEKFNQKFCAAIGGLSVGLPFGKNNVTPMACTGTDFLKQLTEDAVAKGAQVLNAGSGGARCDRTLFAPTADMDDLTSVFEAMPREELRRLYATAKDILEEDAWSGTSSEASVESSWQNPDAGVHMPTVPTGDLLGLGGGADMPVASADTPGSSTDPPAVPVLPGAEVIDLTNTDDEQTVGPDGADVLFDVTAPADVAGGLGSADSGQDLSASGVADDTSGRNLPGAAEVSAGQGPPSDPLGLDLNAMDGVGDDASVPGQPAAAWPTVSQPPPDLGDAAVAGQDDGGTGAAGPGPTDLPPWLTSDAPADPPAAPVPAPVQQPQVARIELFGTAEFPFLNASDVLTGMQIPVLYPVTAEMQLWTAEQFGPVIPIAPYDSIQEPIEWLRKMHFGQQTAIFTSQDGAAPPSAEFAELLDAAGPTMKRVENGPFGGNLSFATFVRTGADVATKFSTMTPALQFLQKLQLMPHEGRV